MISELIVTSVPRGLQAGRSGFTTVMRTKGMHPQLSKGLEGLSAYRHVFAPGDPRNPRIRSHQVIQGPNGPVSVLSRIIDAGNDYSGRSNKLAHNIAIEGATIASRMKSTPAAVLLQLEKTGVFQQQWVGDPREQTTAPSLPMVPVEPGICRKWARIAGDAGWAGVLVDRALRKEPTWIIAPADVDLVELFAEALSLVNYHQRWGISFTSYAMGQGDALWLGTTDGSPEAQAARAQQRILVIDLTRRIPLSLNSPSIDAARGTASVPWKRDIAPTATPAGARPITLEPVSALRPEPSPITPAVTPLGGPRTFAYPTPGPPRIGPPNQAPPWIHEPPPTVTTTDWHDGQSAGKWPMLIWGIAITAVVMVMASTIIIFPEPVREIAMKVSQFVLPPAAGEAEGDAAEKTRKDAAEKTRKDAAEKTRKDAAEKAEKAEKDAAEKTRKDAAEKDAAEKPRKDAAEKAEKDAAEKAEKDAAEKVAADKIATDKVAAEDIKPPVQRLCEAIEEIKHLPQESLFSGTNQTFTLVKYKPFPVCDFDVKLPNYPCDSTDPQKNFLYAKKETDGFKCLGGPTWEVRYGPVGSAKEEACDETDGPVNRKPKRLGNLVFETEKLVFKKEPKVNPLIFDFLRLTCVVITGTEASTSRFMSYLQLSKPVEIPPTVVTPPAELLFVTGTSTKPLTTGTSIIKFFQFDDQILKTLEPSVQVLTKFPKQDLVWTKVTLSGGTTSNLSWTKPADEVSHTVPWTLEWKYKNDETQFLSWSANWSPPPPKMKMLLKTSCVWDCQNFPRINWSNPHNKHHIYTQVLTQVLEKVTKPQGPLNDTSIWVPFCYMVLRNGLDETIQSRQKYDFIDASALIHKNTNTSGTEESKQPCLDERIKFLNKSLLENPWPELTKAATSQVRLAPEEPKAPPAGAPKEKVSEYQKELNEFPGVMAKYKIDIDTKMKEILPYEVKQYLENNKKKLADGPYDKKGFALFCRCFLWDKLKDIDSKILSKADSEAMVGDLGKADMKINFDQEIRWNADAFPPQWIDPNLFMKKEGPVTVVIKTDRTRPAVEPKPPVKPLPLPPLTQAGSDVQDPPPNKSGPTP